MSRLIKIIDENTIELADYRCPEVIFKNSQNPPTLQNIKDEIEHLEWYCTFKTTINPFQMYAENEILHYRINKAIDYINENGITNITCMVGQKPTKTELFKDNASLYELLEILKGSDKE